jgi:hypothetical protein
VRLDRAYIGDRAQPIAAPSVTYFNRTGKQSGVLAMINLEPSLADESSSCLPTRVVK